jgi:hypothetical protein
VIVNTNSEEEAIATIAMDIVRAFLDIILTQDREVKKGDGMVLPLRLSFIMNNSKQPLRQLCRVP